MVGKDREGHPVAFRGGLRRRPLGAGISWPFGHLEFDDASIRIWGGTTDLRFRKSDVEAVRLSRGLLATRVEVIKLDGSVPQQVYFAATRRAPVRMALKLRGWAIDE